MINSGFGEETSWEKIFHCASKLTRESSRREKGNEHGKGNMLKLVVRKSWYCGCSFFYLSWYNFVNFFMIATHGHRNFSPDSRYLSVFGLHLLWKWIMTNLTNINPKWVKSHLGSRGSHQGYSCVSWGRSPTYFLQHYYNIQEPKIHQRVADILLFWQHVNHKLVDYFWRWMLCSRPLLSSHMSACGNCK